MQYGGFSEDGLGDALADLNDAFGGLDGFGEIAAGTFKLAVPVVVGGLVTYGATEALDYFIEDPGTRSSVLPYSWLIGAVFGSVAGLIMWKVPKLGGSTAGVLTIATSITLALIQYLRDYVAKQKALTGFRAYTVNRPQPVYGRFGRYEVKRPQDLFQGTRGLAEGSMVNLRGLGEGQMVNLGRFQGAVNPGVFG